MEFITIKQTLIGFTVFLTILALGSCGLFKDTDPDPQPYISFTLTNSGGATVATATELSRGSTYGLVITPEGGTTTPTADFTITYTPATAITTNVIRPNSVDFTVNNITDRTVTFSVVHRTNSAVSETLTLNLPNQIATSFQQDIENAVTMPYLATANALTREVLEPLGATAGASLVKRYATESGAGNRDGSTWTNAWAATSLRDNINAITDATANRVYLIMVAGGTYKPTTTTSRTISFSMKNHVAIMGGFDPAGSGGRTGTTIFSGDIGTVGDNTDNSYHVFGHVFLTLNNAHLYGVTITNGNANGSATGAAEQTGGGMHNNISSPVLTEVVFSGNTAVRGGGMFNFNGTPVLTRVVFSGNTANGDGGGMANFHASPVIIGAVFRNNRAVNGGGMHNDNNGEAGPLIVNTIFSGNTLSGAGRGANIAMDTDTVNAENIRIAGSVLGLGLAQPTNHIVRYNGSTTLNISYRSLANGAVRFGTDATTAGLIYPTIQTGSSAINIGLHVRRSGTTYYFSEDTTTWYTGFSATGGWGSTGTPPTTAEDLTATDIAGNARSGRPDAGVHELP